MAVVRTDRQKVRSFISCKPFLSCVVSPLSLVLRACNLVRILNRQEVLNSATSTAKRRREAVKSYKVKQQTYFRHRQERERLSMRIKLLQQQLKEQQTTEETGK